MMQDIRWVQRFSNYSKALVKLKESIDYINNNLNQNENSKTHTEEEVVVNELIKEGLIQRFEYTHELAWNVMKDYASYQGNSGIGGSREATREAFQLKIINDGFIWMDMISSRNKSSHTYNDSTAKEIYLKILNEYYQEFLLFEDVMKQILAKKRNDIFGQ